MNETGEIKKSGKDSSVKRTYSFVDSWEDDSKCDRLVQLAQQVHHKRDGKDVKINSYWILLLRIGWHGTQETEYCVDWKGTIKDDDKIEVPKWALVR